VAGPGDERPPDRVLLEFISEAQEIVENLNRDLLALDGARHDAGEPDPEALNDAFRAVHSLKGLSGLFGVASMSQMSHTLETLLDALRLGRVRLAPDILDLLFEAVELYGQLIAATSAGRAPDARGVADFLGRLEKAAAVEAREPEPLADYRLDPSLLSVLTEYEEHRLRESLRAGRTLYRVHAGFELGTIDKALDELKARLRPVGEVITYLPSAESSGPGEDRIDLDVVLASDLPMGAVELALAGTPARVTPVMRPPAGLYPLEDAAADDSLAGSAAPLSTTELPRVAPPPLPVASTLPITPLPVPATLGSPAGGLFGSAGRDLGGATPSADSAQAASLPAESQPAAAAEDRGASLRSVSQTVRVDIRKLDHLMNVVGELALVRAGVLAVLDELRGHREVAELTRRLHRESRSLERKLNELQQGILEVRMVPLGQIFDKLSRVVRRISREADKPVRLTIAGAETELDKLIVEELSDPLMHLIRNAIDHGLEPAGERRRRGKPEAGTIAIRAEQKGNHVVIEIRDDGAGFDERRILEIALRRGLIDRHAAAELTRRELLNLVFLPGFSTRDEANQLSGRGVGMDVVKTNIARLSGLIDLASAAGEGTVITITLPITLAILHALIIRAAGRTYAVPLNSVLESLTLEPGDVRTIEGRKVMSVRGQTLLLSRIDQVLGLEGAEPPPERAYVVVVGVAQHRVGFVVDELVGQQDVVIKSLGPALADVPGIAGATELGGQQIVLVLDVAGLVEEAVRGAEAA
jgi:two-component system chemotaxis sensor kinase CheA